jgi:hypothetical protein
LQARNAQTLRIFPPPATRDEHLPGRFFLRHPQLFHNVIEPKPASTADFRLTCQQQHTSVNSFAISAQKQ